MSNQVIKFEDRVKERMKEIVADLIPDDKWESIVSSTVLEFEKVDLPKLVKDELTEKYKLLIQSEFQKPEWQQKWKEVAEADPVGFSKAQHEFIKKTHFDPQVNLLWNNGIDVSKLDPIFQDIVWSSSVQNGANTPVIANAFKKVGPNAKPEDLVKAIYKERWSGGANFSSSTPAVQKSVYNRFFGQNGEMNQALAQLKSRKDGTGGPGPMPNQPNAGYNAPMNGPSQFTNLGKVTVPFGASTAYEPFHPGVDIANANGTPTPAPVDGKVTDVVTGKQQVKNPNDPNDPNKGFGNQVEITDPYGNKHRYSHLKNAYVRVGDTVKKGQKIATMGNSGSSYSPSGQGDGTHLDYRLQNAAGKYLNPSVVLNQNKMG